MSGRQKVLAHDAEHGGLSDPPSHPGIHPGVTRYALIGQSVDVIESSVPLPVVREAPDRTYLKFVVWDVTLDVSNRPIVARNIGSHVHAQKGEARTDPPVAGDIPVRKNLSAIRAAMRFVVRNHREHGMRRTRGQAEERNPSLIGLQMVVEVQEGREIKRPSRGYLGAIPQLIGKQFLCFALDSAGNLHDSKVAAIEGHDRYVDPNGGIRARGLPDSPCCGGPTSLLSRGHPYELGARFELESGVGVVLEFGSQREPQRIPELHLV